MQVSEVYWNFAVSIKEKLREEVNGIVKFEIYEPIDSIIFKIYFKEFTFSYGIKDVQDIIYYGNSEETVQNILKAYKTTILNGFFKTEERKKREEEKKEGIWEH